MTVAETPMGQLVRALLRWLADPRATFWGEVLRRIGLADESDKVLLARWNRQLAEQGYAAWLDGIFAEAMRENRLSAPPRRLSLWRASRFLARRTPARSAS